MKKILHIVKEKEDLTRVLEIMDQQKKDSDPVLLLIHEAAHHPPPDLTGIFILFHRETRRSGSSENKRTITYKEMLELVFSVDSVVAW